MAKKTIESVILEKHSAFHDEVVGLSVKDLETKVIALAKENENCEKWLDEDPQIKQTKELLAELAGPARDTKKAIKLKTKYLLSLIQEKGGSL